MSFAIIEIWGLWFQIRQEVFKIAAEKYSNKPFTSKIEAILFFHETLQLDRFEGADFKYDNIFVKFYPKNTKIRLLCSRIKVILFSRELFEFKKFEGADFKYDNSL